jgi:hypothetical protein
LLTGSLALAGPRESPASTDPGGLCSASPTGLLALMLLTQARHRARTRLDGTLIPMSDQDRTLWDSEAIAEGEALITGALPRGPIGPLPAPSSDRRHT